MSRSYLFINSKLRARMPDLLGDETLARIESSRSLPEAVQLLAGTGYETVTRVYAETGDIKSAELAMFGRQVEEERMILKYLPRSAVPFFTEWVRRLEAENLKSAFRLWFDHFIRKRNISSQAVYLYRKPVLERIDYDRLLATEDPSGVLSLFDRTCWKEVLNEQLPAVREKESVFRLEVALDRFHYSRLLDAARRLPYNDRKTSRQLLSLLADEQNLLLAFRLKNFGEDGKRLFLDGGGRITRTVFDRLTLLDEGEFLAETARLFPRLTESSGGSLTLDQLFFRFDGQREHRGRRLMSGTPFTIGTPLAYSLIKTLESDRLRNLLNARYYQTGEVR